MKAFNLAKKVEFLLDKKKKKSAAAIFGSNDYASGRTSTTMKISDSIEENCEVEDDNQEEIVGEIFVEVDKKEKLCLDAIYVDFSKYFSLEEAYEPCSKEDSRMSFYQVVVSHVG